MSNWITTESDGRFFASRMGGGYRFESDGGDMGQGHGQQTIVFHSEEARQYFLRAEEANERALAAERELEGLRCRISRLVIPRSGRVRRKKVIELVDHVKGKDKGMKVLDKILRKLDQESIPA